MSRRTHYSPCINRELVRVLYYEARRRRMPMTRLVNELLTDALVGTAGWQIAHNISVVQAEPDPSADQRAQAA
jgi:hypothetical protein